MKRYTAAAIAVLCFFSGLHAQDYVPATFVMPDSTDSVAVAPSEDGISMSCELEGRTIVGRPVSYIGMPVQSGRIAVEIKVNRYGEVSMVSLQDKGTTIIDRDLIDEVCDDAMNTLFNESGEAPAFQFGVMTYSFTVPEPKDTVVILVAPEGIPGSDALTEGSPSSAGGGDASEKAHEVPEENHMLFKKVSMGESTPGFINALRDGGLAYKGMKEDVAFLDGAFAGVNNARIAVFSNGGKPYKVVVDFPGQETWPSMKKQYLYFKRSYTSKYFVSPHSVEKFPSFIPEGSGREHSAFRDESAVYASTFDVPNGEIVISVQPGVNGGRFNLRLVYTDERNSASQETSVMEDL